MGLIIAGISFTLNRYFSTCYEPGPMVATGNQCETTSCLTKLSNTDTDLKITCNEECNIPWWTSVVFYMYDSCPPFFWAILTPNTSTVISISLKAANPSIPPLGGLEQMT